MESTIDHGPIPARRGYTNSDFDLRLAIGNFPSMRPGSSIFFVELALELAKHEADEL
jgi:hypothetical protein